MANRTRPPLGNRASAVALQRDFAMSQVGSDVVIRLDATDSITLKNVAVSSLVPADFKFA